MFVCMSGAADDRLEFVVCFLKQYRQKKTILENEAAIVKTTELQSELNMMSISVARWC